jgi:hypothetical protein
MLKIRNSFKQFLSTLVFMEKYNTKIEAWLNGALEDTQKQAFEQALRTDPELAAAVEAQQKLLLRLEGMRLRQKLDRALQETPLPPDNKPLFTRRVWVFYALLLVSAVLGIVYMLKKNGVGGPFPGSDIIPPAQLPADTVSVSPFTPPVAQAPKNKSSDDKKPYNRLIALAQSRYISPSDDFVRGATDNTSVTTVASAAKTAFANQQYDFVNRLLHNENHWGDETELMCLLRACSRFKTGDFKAAAQDFKRLENSFQYRQEVRWHLMLCTLASGDVITTKQMLDTMIQDTTFAYKEQALALRKAF